MYLFLFSMQSGVYFRCSIVSLSHFAAILLIRTRGRLETCRGQVSTRGGLPRRAGRIPPSPPWRRSKLHIACSDFLRLRQKSQSALIPLLLLSNPQPLRWGAGLLIRGLWPEQNPLCSLVSPFRRCSRILKGFFYRQLE